MGKVTSTGEIHEPEMWRGFTGGDKFVLVEGYIDVAELRYDDARLW